MRAIERLRRGAGLLAVAVRQNDLGRALHVLVYKMNVTEIRDEWPERQLRARVWVTLEEALDRIEEQGLRDLLRVAFHLNKPERLTLATA